mgnify:CR=1 FL=1
MIIARAKLPVSPRNNCIAWSVPNIVIAMTTCLGVAGSVTERLP